jgi:O-methyltransferase involved in polyketide biosynthesis
VEVDLPELLAEKEERLAGEKPVCRVERIRLDLADVAARRECFADLGRRANKALIITEGLLIYLTAEEVASLAQDLATPASFQRWALDLASPGLLSRLQKTVGTGLGQAGVPMKFGPKEGPNFFAPYGWHPLDVRSMLKTAASLGRVSFFMRLLALLPESKGEQGSRPWGGICLVGKRGG